MVDAEARNLLDTIRETQNKSISVVRNKNNLPPLSWSLKVRANGYDIASYDNSTGSIKNAGTESSKSFGGGVTLKAVKVNGLNRTDTTLPLYVDYSAPFGRLYVVGSTGDCGGADACTWVKNESQTGDYKPSVSPLILNDNKIYFEIGNSKYKRTVWLNTNGDAYLGE
jgi:hypothetical protein